MIASGRKGWIVLLCALAFIKPLLATHAPSKYEGFDEDGHVEIRVLVCENIEGALLDVSGAYKIYDPDTNKVISSSFFAKRNYLQANGAGLKWGEGFPGTFKMRIVPNSESNSILVNGVQYKGALAIYNVSGKVQIVNELDVEDFLKAYLSGELSATNYNKTTYEALAIVARTHFYHCILERNNPYWDIKKEMIHFQGHASSKTHGDVDKGVDATRGLILTYKDLPFATAWTAHCGGTTASYETIFRKKALGPEGVLVAYAKKEREESRWKCTLSNRELCELLGLSSIHSVDVYKDPSSKKAYAIRFADEHRIVELNFFQFQEMIGANRLKSTDFSVHLVKDYLLFEGFGQGPGVGLCLFSADQMAKYGDSAPHILSNFYPSTSLVKLCSIPESLLVEGE